MLTLGRQARLENIYEAKVQVTFYLKHLFKLQRKRRLHFVVESACCLGIICACSHYTPHGMFFFLEPTVGGQLEFQYVSNLNMLLSSVAQGCRQAAN